MKTVKLSCLKKYSVSFLPPNSMSQMETYSSEVIYVQNQGEVRVINVLIIHYLMIFLNPSL